MYSFYVFVLPYVLEEDEVALAVMIPYVFVLKSFTCIFKKRTLTVWGWKTHR
jgi:hypothetical protein